MFSLILTCILGLFVPATSSTLLIYSAAKDVKVNSHLYYIDGKNGTLYPFDSIIKKLPFNSPSKFQFSVENQESDTLQCYISMGERFVKTQNLQIYLGDSLLEAHEEPANYFSLSIPSGKKYTIVFSLSELNRIDPNKLSVNLYSKDFFQYKEHRMEVAQSFFLGLNAFLCLFHLIIFFVTGWKVYLKYVIYLFVALLYFLFYYGLIQTALPQLNAASINLVSIWYSLIYVLYFYFLNDFGNYKQFSPWADKLLNVGIINKCIQITYETVFHFFGYSFMYEPIYKNIILVFEITLMAFIIYFILKNKNVRGKFVIVATLFLIFGAILGQLDLEPDIRGYCVQLGISAEFLVFSVGLGYLSKLHYIEKQQAQQLYIAQLTENEKIQKSINEELEKKVKQRTNELEIEKLTVEKKNRENELLLSEIHHRVKNNLQVIASLLSIQERNIKNEDIKQAILSSKGRIYSMELVHKMLYSENSFQGIEMKAYCQSLFQALAVSYGVEKEECVIKTDFEALTIDTNTALNMGLILNELISNIFKHAKTADKKLLVEVDIYEKENDIFLTCADNGNGNAQHIAQSHSFGLKIIHLLVSQMNGHIQFSNNNGLRVEITLKKDLKL